MSRKVAGRRLARFSHPYISLIILLIPVSAFINGLVVRVSVRPKIIPAVIQGIGLLRAIPALLILKVLLWGSPGCVSLTRRGSVFGHSICFLIILIKYNFIYSDPKQNNNSI